MSESTFEPNTFMTPNEYVDRYLPYLTGEEVKVLLYATRRILGFQKRQDRISMSLFTTGMRSKEGEVLDMGTGLSNATVKKCLDNLVAFGLLVHVQDNDKKKNEGVLWSLQWKKANVNEKALQERAAKKDEKQKGKMVKARSMRHTHPNGIEGGSGNGIEQPPANGIETQNTEKPSRKKVKEGAEKPRQPKASDFPSNVLFREVTNYWPQKANWHTVLHAVSEIEKRLQRAAVRDDLFPFFEAWCGRGNKPVNIAWLTEWAVSGVIPGRQNTPQQDKGAVRSNGITQMLNNWLAEKEAAYGN